MWRKSAGQSSYHVEHLPKDNFAPGQTQGFALNDTSLQLTNLGSERTYYWHVGVGSSSSGTFSQQWSETWIFTTKDGTALLVPLLVSPRDGATDVSANPRLVWKKTAGASSYQVQISDKNNFDRDLFQSVTSSDTAVSVSGPSGGTKYYWRVGALSGASTSSDAVWSDVWKFSTTGGQTPPSSAPDPPSGLQLMKLSESAAILTWSGGGAGVRFELGYRQSALPTRTRLRLTLYGHCHLGQPTTGE